MVPATLEDRVVTLFHVTTVVLETAGFGQSNARPT
jgi:hypothetical protein